MKKVVIMFTVLLICVLTFFGCEGEEQNVTRYTVNIYYGNISYDSMSYARGDSLAAQDLQLPPSLKQNYYVLDWYLDSNYTNSFKEIKISSNVNIYGKLEALKNSADYEFCQSVDEQKLLNYLERKANFVSVDNATNMDLIKVLSYQEKGYGDCYYRISQTDVLTTAKIEREILYFPDVDLFITSYSMSFLQPITNNLSYISTYAGTLELKLGQKLSEGKYNGIYNHTWLNSYTNQTSGEYTAKFTFEPKKVILSKCGFADFSTCRYSYNITKASNYSKAENHLKSELQDIGTKCYVRLNNCFELLNTVLGMVDLNYKVF